MRSAGNLLIAYCLLAIPVAYWRGITWGTEALFSAAMVILLAVAAYPLRPALKAVVACAGAAWAGPLLGVSGVEYALPLLLWSAVITTPNTHKSKGMRIFAAASAAVFAGYLLDTLPNLNSFGGGESPWVLCVVLGLPAAATLLVRGSIYEDRGIVCVALAVLCPAAVMALELIPFVWTIIDSDYIISQSIRLAVPSSMVVPALVAAKHDRGKQWK